MLLPIKIEIQYESGSGQAAIDQARKDVQDGINRASSQIANSTSSGSSRGGSTPSSGNEFFDFPKKSGVQQQALQQQYAARVRISKGYYDEDLAAAAGYARQLRDNRRQQESEQTGVADAAARSASKLAAQRQNEARAIQIDRLNQRQKNVGLPAFDEDERKELQVMGRRDFAGIQRVSSESIQSKKQEATERLKNASGVDREVAAMDKLHEQGLRENYLWDKKKAQKNASSLLPETPGDSDEKQMVNAGERRLQWLDSFRRRVKEKTGKDVEGLEGQSDASLLASLSGLTPRQFKKLQDESGQGLRQVIGNLKEVAKKSPQDLSTSLPSGALSLMQKELPGQIKETLFPPMPTEFLEHGAIAGEMFGSGFGASLKRFVSGGVRDILRAGGLGFGTSSAVGNLLAGAGAEIIPPLVLAAGAYAAYNENARLADYEGTTGVRTGMRGLRRTIGEASQTPDFAQTGHLYDILGLPGYLTEGRKYAATGEAANALASIQPTGFTSDQLSRFQRISQRSGQKPEDVAKQLSAGLEGLPIEQRLALQEQRARRMDTEEKALATYNANTGWRAALAGGLNAVTLGAATGQDPITFGQSQRRAADRANQTILGTDSASVRDRDVEAQKNLEQSERLQQIREGAIERTGGVQTAVAAFASERTSLEDMAAARLQTSEAMHGIIGDPMRRLTGELADIETGRVNQHQRIKDSVEKSSELVNATANAEIAAKDKFTKGSDAFVQRRIADQNTKMLHGQMRPDERHDENFFRDIYQSDPNQGALDYNQLDAARSAHANAQQAYNKQLAEAPSQHATADVNAEEAARRQTIREQHQKELEEAQAESRQASSFSERVLQPTVTQEAIEQDPREKAKLQRGIITNRFQQQRDEINKRQAVQQTAGTPQGLAELETLHNDEERAINAANQNEVNNLKLIEDQTGILQKKTVARKTVDRLREESRQTTDPTQRQSKAAEAAQAEFNARKDELDILLKAEGQDHIVKEVYDVRLAEAKQRLESSKESARVDKLLLDVQQGNAVVRSETALVETELAAKAGRPGVTRLAAQDFQQQERRTKITGLRQQEALVRPVDAHQADILANQAKGEEALLETDVVREDFERGAGRGPTVGGEAAFARLSKRQTERGERRRKNLADQVRQDALHGAAMGDPDIRDARNRLSGINPDEWVDPVQASVDTIRGGRDSRGSSMDRLNPLKQQDRINKDVDQIRGGPGGHDFSNATHAHALMKQQLEHDKLHLPTENDMFHARRNLEDHPRGGADVGGAPLNQMSQGVIAVVGGLERLKTVLDGINAPNFGQSGNNQPPVVRNPEGVGQR